MMQLFVLVKRWMAFLLSNLAIYHEILIRQTKNKKKKKKGE